MPYIKCFKVDSPFLLVYTMSSGFISFGDVAGKTSNYKESALNERREREQLSSLSSPIYVGIPSLAAISKRLQKKGAITRLKALLDLEDELRSCSEDSDASATIGFLPFFLFTFERMWMENDRKIREELFRCLNIIITNKMACA